MTTATSPAPAAAGADTKALEQQLYMRTFARQPITLVRGAGVRVWDDEGKEYLDFLAGIAVNVLGHCPPVLVKTVQEQVATLIHTTNLYYTTPQMDLAQLLVQHSVLDRVFYANSGAEANEAAIKLARKWGKRHKNGAYEIITTWNSFHGRTLATVAATGNRHYQEPFDPMPAGFKHVAFNDLEAMREAVTDQTVAILLEPVQGESGVHAATKDYLQGVRKLCDERNVLFMLDEVQSGMGRTGTLWAYEQYGVEPYVMTLAKGLAGGLPIGACLAKEHAAVFEPGDHGSTFAGNPLVCAAGYAVLKEILDKDLAGNAERMGQRIVAGLEELQKESDSGITEIRSAGLWVGIEFGTEKATDILNRCRENGLLVNKTSNTAIRLAPPLILTEADVDQFLDIFGRAVSA
ncbi:MAG: Acetylornithine aminotransferase [uncultured Chloroflexi bacterium]|uniref:Acetylornithine aminotransferase n=1 Tax=uncultured Chloroflexota bacterium TaxID=166587 RepID=A0A6J4K3E3_9CHLR|nr:MAG: Acetylornithine aminotransferase [uncultured Chloroflexota bacterium]